MTSTGVPFGSGAWTVPLKMTRSGEPTYADIGSSAMQSQAATGSAIAR